MLYSQFIDTTAGALYADYFNPDAPYFVTDAHHDLHAALCSVAISAHWTPLECVTTIKAYYGSKLVYQETREFWDKFAMLAYLEKHIPLSELEDGN